MSADSEFDRRRFLKVGAAATLLPFAAPSQARTPTSGLGRAKNAILLLLTGGPSQIDTWDPKPDAPREIRGPFASIPTRTPGVHFSELFPKMAAISDRFSLIRSLHHTEAPLHELGFQLLNTGKAYGAGTPWPSIGSVVAHLRGQKNGPHYAPFYHVCPSPQVETGIDIDRGFGAGHLTEWEPYKYQSHPWSDLWARLEKHEHFITYNMYSTVFDAVSWDCHADATGSLRTSLQDYRNTVAPSFDTIFTTLIQGLEARGLLESTLVVAAGEFGRTPRLNCHGGRDHWSNAWTAIVAGGGVQGGRVIGATDAHGAEPKDRPVTCAELAATIYHALGVPSTTMIPGADGIQTRVVDAAPVRELF